MIRTMMIATIVLAATGVSALENTKANRLEQAKRYLEATPAKEMVLEMAKNMSQRVPEARRQEFIDVMTKHIDMVSLRKTMIDAMVTHFTADELKALADFYGSPVGKSAMKKFGLYMKDVMPEMQTAVMQAFSKFLEGEQAEQ